MLKWALQKLARRYGYYPIDYGYACGRHWLNINGVNIYQGSSELSLSDETVHKLGYLTVDRGKHWRVPG